MKQIVKTFKNLIKKTIFNVWNKTNINLKIDSLNIVKKFNKSAEKTILKAWNKININFKIDNLNIVKKFNKSVEKTILNVQNKASDQLLLFKVQNKTKNKLLISKFNKYLITFISLLFFYLFYLLIPILYDKNWVQRNIENQLLENFKIHFSLSSNISYRILPSPHYLITDSKILKKDNKIISLANIKILKVFISQKNFFNKKKMSLKNIKIKNADFTLIQTDLKLLKDSANNKFSNKKIEISKSNIFFKNNLDEIISVIKISKGFLFQDDENLFNLFKLKGQIFNIPFDLNFKKKFDLMGTEEININAKSLKLDIINVHSHEDKNISKGENIISFLNSEIIINYKMEDDIIVFNSNNSRVKNSKVSYIGKVSVNPFDLNLKIDLGNYDLHKFFNSKSILIELFKTKLLINENISTNTSISIGPNLRNKIFQNAIINFNIIDGELNFNQTRLSNKKIGLLELDNSKLSYENNKLFLNTDIIINIKNSDKLYSLLQTNKRFRKPITNILINLDYDFLSEEVNFNNIKIDNRQINNELLRIIEGFNDNELINWNKSKRILNTFFKNYEG